MGEQGQEAGECQARHRALARAVAEGRGRRNPERGALGPHAPAAQIVRDASSFHHQTPLIMK